MDVATLELRVDPSGVVTGTARMNTALGDMESKGNKTADSIKHAFMVLGAYLGAHQLLHFFNEITEATKRAELANVRLAGVLRATGERAGFTAEQLHAISEEMSHNSLFDDEMIKNAAARLATFGNIVGPVFERTLRLAADLATLTGDDLSGAIMQLGKAVEDPIRGLQLLARAGIALSTVQRALIQDAIRHGDVLRAQTLLLDAIQGKVGGLAGASHTGLTGSIHELKLEWENFLESLGQTPGMAQTAANALALVADAVAGFIQTIAPSRALLEDILREERDAKLAQLEAGQRPGVSGAIHRALVPGEAALLANQIADLTTRIDHLRGQSVEAMNAAGEAARTAANAHLAVVHQAADQEKKMSDQHRAALNMFVQSLQNESAAHEAARQAATDAAEKNRAEMDEKIRLEQEYQDKLLHTAKAMENLSRVQESIGAQDSLRKPSPLGDILGSLQGFIGVGASAGGMIAGAGALISGPAAMAIPLLSSLADKIFGTGRAAAEAAAREQQLADARRQSALSIRQYSLSATGTQLDQALQQNKEQADALITQLIALSKTGVITSKEFLAGMQDVERARAILEARIKADAQQRTTEALEDYRVRRMRATNMNEEADQLEFVNRLHREYAQAIKDGASAAQLADLAETQLLEARQRAADLATQKARAVEDLQVRLLRATAGDKAADDLAFALQQQREYEDALRRGADAAYLAKLRQVQLAEATKYASDKIRATIEGLKSTVDSLTSFSMSLKFGPGSTASPMSQLAAARQQFQTISRLALAGDQTAANQLPEVARAFLEISRQVNASSMAYQRDLQDVQDVIDSVTALFQGQIDAQQKMLEALGENGPIVGTLIKKFDEQMPILVAGFQQLSDTTAALADAITRGNDKIAKAMEGISLN